MRKWIIYICLGALFILPVCSFGQEADSTINVEIKPFKKTWRTKKPRRIKEWGLNLSPLLVQFTPFRRTAARTGPYNISYKDLRRDGTRAFRMGLGLFIDAENEERNHINFRIGRERRREITEKVRFIHGIDFIFFAGHMNIPNESDPVFFDATGIGLGLPLGLEYDINKMMSLSTESFLYIGTHSINGVGLQIVPPVALFLNVRF